jgi:ADP-ribosyltransferase exoenzyme
MGRRNSNSTPAQSPVRCVQFFMTRPEKILKLKQHLCDKFDLSSDEAQQLTHFKGNSKPINERIRKCQLTSGDNIFCQQLESALRKLPSTKETIIYRNINLLDFQLTKATDYFKVGTDIRFREFLSCTTRKCFTGDSSHFNWIIKILTSQGSQAKNIFTLWDEFELNDSEKEVIYPWNSCFKILELKIIQDCINMTIEEIQLDMNITPVTEF